MKISQRNPYEFRKPIKNQARDEILTAMQDEPLSKSELIKIGKRYGLFEGEVTGMLQALATNGDIKRSSSRGWWALPETVEPVITTRSYWLVQGLDGTWLEPDNSETSDQAVEAALELKTAYRYVISTEIIQQFDIKPHA